MDGIAVVGTFTCPEEGICCILRRLVLSCFDEASKSAANFCEVADKGTNRCR